MKKLLSLGLMALAALAAAATASGAIVATDRVVADERRDDARVHVTGPGRTYAWLHCYGAQQIRSAYGVDSLGNTTAAARAGPDDRARGLLRRADRRGRPAGVPRRFLPDLPAPNFTAVYPNGAPDFKNVGNGQSGSSGAAGWAGEATLDIEWAYAIAPLAHIVLIGVPPAETEGVQGFPNLFKAISRRDRHVPERHGLLDELRRHRADLRRRDEAAQTQKFDAVFQKGIAKGDTFFASSGDDGSIGRLEAASGQRQLQLPDRRLAGFEPVRHRRRRHAAAVRLALEPAQRRRVQRRRRLQPGVLAATRATRRRERRLERVVVPVRDRRRPERALPAPELAGRRPAGCRESPAVPDVAWNASVNGGVLVYTSFFPSINRVGWHVYGGTSAASPQVAALTALAAQQARSRARQHQHRDLRTPGCVHRRQPVRQGSPSIISGDLSSNRMFDYNGDGLPVTRDPIPGWATTGGYDMTTGFGTPNAAAYVSALVGP